MLNKASNYTRYNTDDLNDILNTIADQYYRGTQPGSNTPYEVHFKTEGWQSVRASAEDPADMPYARTRNLRGAVSNLVYGVRKSTIRIPSIRLLTSHPDHSLAMVGVMSQDVPALPASIVEDIVTVFLIGCGSTEFNPRSHTHHQNAVTGGTPNWVGARRPLDKDLLVEKAKEIATHHRVRIMKNVEAGPAVHRKLTREEKLDRLLSSSFYGSGGVLEGPGWAYRSGGRAATGQWRYRIHEARRYYEIEKKARERHAEAIVKLGGTPVPYESFSEYLRRMANEIEE